MNNSLHLILGFLGFLVFGYLSVLRIATKQYFPESSLSSVIKSLFTNLNALANLGSGALFISLPAASLLLFWGWAPALLWLLIAHILIDSISHLQVATAEQISSPRTHASQGLQGLESMLQYLFYVLILGVVLAFMANLIDRQSGLLFALACLFPAYRVLNGYFSSERFINVLLALLVFSIGIIFASRLGISIYGEWKILGQLYEPYTSWLTFNNETLLALALLLGARMVAQSHENELSVTTQSLTSGQNQPSSSSSLHYQIAVFAGVLVVLASIALLLRLGVLQALIDAPINANGPINQQSNDDITSASGMPWLVGCCLLFFWSLGALYIRINNQVGSVASKLTIAQRFGNLQWQSLLAVLLSLVLITALASAIGIGAWSTHYQESFETIEINQHFLLATSALEELLQLSNSKFTATLFLIGLSLTGLSFLSTCVQKVTTNSVSKKSNNWTSVMPILGFLVACFFIKHGVSMAWWCVLGVLSWHLLSLHLIRACTAVNNVSSSQNLGVIAHVITIIVVTLGTLQCIYLSLFWISLDEWVTGTVIAGLLLCSITLWSRDFWALSTDLASRADKHAKL